MSVEANSDVFIVSWLRNVYVLASKLPRALVFLLGLHRFMFAFQVFSYTANKEIRTDDLCLDVSKLNGPVTMLKCHHLKGNQLWEYDPVVSQLAACGDRCWARHRAHRQLGADMSLVTDTARVAVTVVQVSSLFLDCALATVGVTAPLL